MFYISPESSCPSLEILAVFMNMKHRLIVTGYLQFRMIGNFPYQIVVFVKWG